MKNCNALDVFQSYCLIRTFFYDHDVGVPLRTGRVAGANVAAGEKISTTFMFNCRVFFEWLHKLMVIFIKGSFSTG